MTTHNIFTKLANRMESRDDFMDRFEELMDEAPDEVTRKKFEKLMMEMR